MFAFVVKLGKSQRFFGTHRTFLLAALLLCGLRVWSIISPTKEMFAARVVRRALPSAERKFSTIFESKNKIPEVRQKYYSNPAVGKKSAHRNAHKDEFTTLCGFVAVDACEECCLVPGSMSWENSTDFSFLPSAKKEEKKRRTITTDQEADCGILPCVVNGALTNSDSQRTDTCACARRKKLVDTII